MEEDEDGVVDQVVEFVESRWTGKGKVVGLKHDAHGLAYTMGVVSRLTVIAVMGQAFDDRVMFSFSGVQRNAAIHTYAAGDAHKETLLLLEYDSFMGGIHPDYKQKIDATRDMVEKIVADEIKKMDDETKEMPLRRLIAILEKRESLLPTDGAWWSSMPKGDTERGLARSESRSALVLMGIELSRVVGHACSVERVNKDHKNVVSKLRNKMHPDTVRKLLYVYCNARTMYNTQMPFDQFAMLMLDSDDARAILEGLTCSETELQLMQSDPTDADQDEKDDSDTDDDEKDEDNTYTRTCEIPEGLEWVDKPDELDERTSQYFVTCMWDVQTSTGHIWGWYVGKVLKYIPKRTRFNYLIAYGEDPGTEQSLRLENYKLEPPAEDEEALIYDKESKPVQTWAFLKRKAI